MSQKFFSTVQFAKFCGVGQQTVLRWIKIGLLDAVQLPGSGDNRIPAPEGVRFLRQQGIPIPRQLKPYVGKPGVMVVEKKPEITDALKADARFSDCTIQHAESLFQAGALSTQSPPAVIIVTRPRTEASKRLIEFAKTDKNLANTAILTVSAKKSSTAIADSVRDMLDER